MTEGERTSCGVEVEGTVGDGSAGDGAAGYSHPESGEGAQRHQQLWWFGLVGAGGIAHRLMRWRPRMVRLGGRRL
jgi:hypothetical protein